jgi:O-antigen ligase
MKLDRRGVVFLLRNPFLAPFRTTGSLTAITNMSNYDNASTPSLRRTEWMVGALGFATVAITTWGFAGKSSWAPLGFTVLSFLAAAVSVLSSRREGLRFNGRAFIPFIAFALIVVASIFNPSHQRVPGRADAWMEREAYLTWLPSTVAPAITVSAMLPWLSALLLGAALRQAELGRRAARLLWGALLGHCVLVALVGIYFFFIDRGHILGFVKARQGYHFATFLYRNHWSAFMLLHIAVAVGFALSALRAWQTGRGRLDSTLIGWGSALVLTITIAMPGSRSGLMIALLMLMVGLGRFSWMLLRTHNSQAPTYLARTVRLAVGLVFVGGIVIAGIAFNRDTIRPHWLRTQNQFKEVVAGQEDLRYSLSRDACRMAFDRPVWGWGVGSFGLVFPLFQGNYLKSASGETSTRVMHAHNDWAEMAAEMGVVGVLVLTLPVIILLAQGARSTGVLKRWGRAGAVVLLAYALIDFPFQCPAVLFMFTVLICTASALDSGSPK